MFSATRMENVCVKILWMVRNVLPVNPHTLVFQVAKVCLICNLFWGSILNVVLLSECKCNPDGSTTMECDGVNGDCTCKEGFTGTKCHECKPSISGDKCDKCAPTFYDYPSCKGISN